MASQQDQIARLLETTTSQLFPEIRLKDEQREAILAIIDNNDVIVNLPVGFGKSLIFHLLPSMLDQVGKPNKVVVISPLTTIMKDQMEKVTKIGIKAVQLSQNGQVYGKEKEDVVEAVRNCSMIFTHPEALIEADSRNEILSTLKGKIGVIVIDECHKIDDWGKDFRKSFLRIGDLRSFCPASPVACLSGTITDSHIKILSKTLNLSNLKIISKNPDKKNLILERHQKEKGVSLGNEKVYKKEIDALKKLGSTYPVTIIFMPLQYIADAMQYSYDLFGGKSVVTIDNAVFGCLYTNQDKIVMDTILSDLCKDNPRFRLIFSTTVIGMGFDPPAIDHVIHLKPPCNITNYFQEIGRAGRRGQKAKATLYFCPSDLSKNRVGMTDEIIAYCNEKKCLRECLLSHFGHKKNDSSPNGCSCCNVCFCDCDDCLLADAVSTLSV